MFWLDTLAALAAFYIFFHWTPVIEFLDHLIAVRP
jgi:hypothetical protein